jgi:predicted NAD-dependent protein-ADP-ribosyltransferase YbiA (DUF1768 family)
MQPTYIYFNSNANAPRHLLSNFSAAPIVFTEAHICPAIGDVCPRIYEWMQERTLTFPSSEHLWQALKAATLDVFLAFASGGRLSGCDVLMAIYDEKGLNKWKWWMRKGCVGIAAKLAANPKHKIRLDLVGKMHYAREQLPLPLEQEVWLAILRLKFKQCAAHRRVLLETGDTPLIEFDKGAGKKGAKASHWGGMWCKEIHKLVGENVMGRYLMEIRDELRSAAAANAWL